MLRVQDSSLPHLYYPHHSVLQCWRGPSPRSDCWEGRQLRAKHQDNVKYLRQALLRLDISFFLRERPGTCNRKCQYFRRLRNTGDERIVESEENISWVNDTAGADKKHTMVESYHKSKVMLQLYLWNIIVWTVIASLKAGLLPASMLSTFIHSF